MPAALAARGRIAFDDVSFAYGRQAGGVEHIDLTIAPGEKLGIVGASGAGKSTLVALLLRLYDPKRAGSASTGRTCATSPRKACAARSAWSRRKPRCSTARRATTSSMAAPTRPRTR
jgi:ABC-type transport system involved in cytochrome bd biosynthesis fused ATPase/permease subunit